MHYYLSEDLPSFPFLFIYGLLIKFNQYEYGMGLTGCKLPLVWNPIKDEWTMLVFFSKN